MMYSQNKGAAQYRAVRSHGLVADASPTRLVQIMFEQVLTNLATAGGCMGRICDNRPANDVLAKGKAIGKAVALIGQLNGTLDMERGGEIAANLGSLYVYLMSRLTLANAANDVQIVEEVTKLVREIKSGWDQIVTDAR
jgi:flagellar protein FliS